MITQLTRNKSANSPLFNASYDSMLLKQSFPEEKNYNKTSIRTQGNYLVATAKINLTRTEKESYKADIDKQIQERDTKLQQMKSERSQPYTGFFPNGTEEFKKKFEKLYSKQEGEIIISHTAQPEEGKSILMLPSMKEQSKLSHNGLYFEIPKFQQRVQSNPATPVSKLGSMPRPENWKQLNQKVQMDNLKLTGQYKTQEQKINQSIENENRRIVEKDKQEVFS
jgi:hypothetical protein